MNSLYRGAAFNRKSTKMVSCLNESALVISNGVKLELNCGLYQNAVCSAISPVAPVARLAAAALRLLGSTDTCVMWVPGVMHTRCRTALPATVEPVLRITALFVSLEAGTFPYAENVAWIGNTLSRTDGCRCWGRQNAVARAGVQCVASITWSCTLTGTPCSCWGGVVGWAWWAHTLARIFIESGAIWALWLWTFALARVSHLLHYQTIWTHRGVTHTQCSSFVSHLITRTDASLTLWIVLLPLDWAKTFICEGINYLVSLTHTAVWQVIIVSLPWTLAPFIRLLKPLWAVALTFIKVFTRWEFTSNSALTHASIIFYFGSVVTWAHRAVANLQIFIECLAFNGADALLVVWVIQLIPWAFTGMGVRVIILPSGAGAVLVYVAVYITLRADTTLRCGVPDLKSWT